MNINTFNYARIKLFKHATLDDIKIIKRHFLNHYWFEEVLFKIDHFNHTLLVKYETHQQSNRFDSLKETYQKFNHLIKSITLDLKNEYFGLIGHGIINENNNELNVIDLNWVDLKETTLKWLFPVLNQLLKKYNKDLDYLYLKLFSWLNFSNIHEFLSYIKLQYYGYEDLEYVINLDFKKYLMNLDYHTICKLEIKSLDEFLKTLLDMM